jgi:V/A-type H+/Na+-transporting ATPase subunit C
MLQGLYLVTSGKKGTLSIGKYPYTYARVSAMKAFLLKKEDYHKLMKMDVNEITNYLENSQYKKEIDELGVQFKGVKLMTLALNKNLRNTFAKIKRISSSALKIIVTAYLLRVDIWNIKTIIRTKYTNSDVAELKAMLLPGGLLTEKILADLVKKDSIDDILKSLKILDYSYFADAVEEFNKTKSISEIENALDRFYYATMKEFSDRVPNEGKLFKQFLQAELEINTIINILRIKRANVSAKEIGKYVIVPKTSKALIHKIANAATAEDAVKVLEQTGKFKGFVETGVEEFLAKGSLVRLETDLSQLLLKRSSLLIHQHPLSVDVILGYMLAKEIEVRNLKLILKSKQLGLDDEFVEKQIVM